MYKGISKFISSKGITRFDWTKDPKKKGVPKPPQKVCSYFAEGKPVLGIVLGEVKGGYRIRIIKPSYYDHAFCPHSQMYPPIESASQIKNLCHEQMLFRIIEIKIKEKSVILSRKKQIEEEAWIEVMKRFETNEVLIGTISKLHTYGAIVDIGVLKGLLHISQISDDFIENIKTVLRKGQQIRVKILEVDRERKRLSLTLKDV